MSIFGPSKLTLQLDRYNYTAGETITGKLILASDAPIKTEGIRINLLGERKNSSAILDAKSITQSNSHNYFYNQSITILPAGEYTHEELVFSYNIPQGIIEDEGGFFEKLGNFPPWIIMLLNLLLSYNRLTKPRSICQFTVTGVVDIPWGIDLTEKVNIEILPLKGGNIRADSVIPPEIQNIIKDKNITKI